MPIADAYREDLAFIHDVDYGSIAREAAARLAGELSRIESPRAPVIDLGCGSGILAQLLIDAGYPVIGIDVSAAMVSLARARAPRGEFHIGSFVSSDLPVCLAVTAVGEVLNYEFDPANDDRARSALFRRVYDALVPGGVFLFDVATAERARPDGPHRTFAEGADWAVLVETRFEPAARRLTRTITSFRQVGPAYRRDREVHKLILLDQKEVLADLRAVGFEAHTTARYRTLPLPPGVVVVEARKAPAAAGGVR